MAGLQSAFWSRWLVIVFAALVAFAPLRAEAEVGAGAEVGCAEAHDPSGGIGDEATHAGHGAQHAHGCGSCHFHAVPMGASELIGATVTAKRRALLYNDILHGAGSSGLFRPPRA